MAEQIFTSLAIVIWVVLVTLYLMKVLKQPMIIWYIIAGTLISIFIPQLLHANTAFQSFGNIGISFLLFMVGMELNPLIIKDMWKTSLIAGTSQVLITWALWFLIASCLGFGHMTALYLGIGFAFSSTIVVLKLLSDREEIESNSWRLSIGILIIQDIIVMLLILGMGTFQNIHQTASWGIIVIVILKMLGLAAALILISKYIIPKITKKIAESQEYLFLFSIGRCFLLGAVFYRLWFGIEIGTLVAGATLANSAYRFEITSRIKPLRDFFIVIFFVMLGSQVNFSHQIHFLPQILIFSAFVLIWKPIITMIILWLMGHTRKNNFLTGISLGQISEFSFLLVAMGIQSWCIKDPTLISLITLIGLITIAGSSYFITYGEKLYYLIKPLLRILPGIWQKEYRKINEQEYEIVLFGYGRFGSNLYTLLQKKHPKILVIDEHPGIISHLQQNKIPCIYGDIGDIDFLEELNVKNSKMLISTVKGFDENMILLKTMKKINPTVIIILVSNHIHEALKLYEQGADYVILPHYIGIDHTSLMLEEYGFDIDKFMQNKKSQINDLSNRHQDLMIEMLQK